MLKGGETAVIKSSVFENGEEFWKKDKKKLAGCVCEGMEAYFSIHGLPHCMHHSTKEKVAT